MTALGRPRMLLTLPPAVARRGYSQYRQGFRNPYTILAMREYTRAHQRHRRQVAADAHLSR